MDASGGWCVDDDGGGGAWWAVVNVMVVPDPSFLLSGLALVASLFNKPDITTLTDLPCFRGRASWPAPPPAPHPEAGSGVVWPDGRGKRDSNEP